MEKVGQSQVLGQDYYGEPFYAGWILSYQGGITAGCGEAELKSNDWNGNILKNNNIRMYFNNQYQTNYDYAIYYSTAQSGCEVHYSVESVNGIGSAQGNMALNPLMVDPEANDFSLQSISPMIDAGIIVNDPNANIGGWTQLTFEGSAPDIGAFEYF